MRGQVARQRQLLLPQPEHADFTFSDVDALALMQCC